jgi:cyclic beta-1,2-glucan synthetase
VSYRYGASRYRVAVENPEGRCGGVARIELDGAELSSDAIPLLDDGRDHDVRVLMGAPGAPTAVETRPSDANTPR